MMWSVPLFFWQLVVSAECAQESGVAALVLRAKQASGLKKRGGRRQHPTQSQSGPPFELGFDVPVVDPCSTMRLDKDRSLTLLSSWGHICHVSMHSTHAQCDAGMQDQTGSAPGFGLQLGSKQLAARGSRQLCRSYFTPTLPCEQAVRLAQPPHYLSFIQSKEHCKRHPRHPR